MSRSSILHKTLSAIFAGELGVKYGMSVKVLKIIVAVISVLVGGSALFVHLNPIVCKIEYNESNLKSLETALKLFYLDTGRYPNNEEGLSILISKNRKSEITGYSTLGYIENLPNDKWGNPYHYFKYNIEPDNEIINIWSFGADSLPSGEGENRDINHIIYIKNN